MPELLRGAKYSRASDDTARHDARSVGEQDEENGRFMGRHGLVLIPGGSYSDNNLSASRFATKAREDWDRFLADLPSRRWDVSVLWTTSRGDRTAASWMNFLDNSRLYAPLVGISSHDEIYDVRKPRHWKTLAEEGINNAYRSEESSVDLQRTAKSQVEKGAVWGPCPYGYQRTYNPETGAVTGQEPHPAHAPIVRQIIERTAEGIPVSWQLADLTSRGVPSPRGVAWTAATIRKIAGNPVYIAKRSWRVEPGRLFDASWPALVRPEIYWDAAAVVDSRKKGRRRDGRIRWLLSLIATCGECGALLVSRSGATAGARRTYVCNGNPADIYSTKRGCVHIVADWLDTWVTERVKNRLSQEDIYTQLAAPDQEASSAARARADELRAQLDKARAAVAALTMTVESFTAIEAAVLPAIAMADSEARSLSLPPALRKLAGRRREYIDAAWADMPIAAQRDIIRTLLDKVEVVRAVGADRTSHKFSSARIRMRWAGDDEDS